MLCFSGNSEKLLLFFSLHNEEVPSVQNNKYESEQV